MRAHTTRHTTGSLLYHRGWWLYVRRPLLICRAFRHRPVVDGYEPFRPGGNAGRWVACGRCGHRPTPQGSLDPVLWPIGARYTGPWLEAEPAPLSRAQIEERVRADLPLDDLRQPPGPWRRPDRTDLHAELAFGRTSSRRIGVEIKVGNPGSENRLGLDIHAGPIGSLYLSSGAFGTWLQRRLNPAGYDSRVTGITLDGLTLAWRLWDKRDEWSRDTPYWMHGSLDLDLRNHLRGPVRYAHDKIGDPVPVMLRLPHGDDHEVKLQLEHVTRGRTRGRRRFEHWTVNWTCWTGIYTEPYDHGTVCGASVEVSTAAVNAGTWPQEAAARIALQVAEYRTQGGYHRQEAHV
jgi:hypothetical protein